jgi:hypothetical protein
METQGNTQQYSVTSQKTEFFTELMQKPQILHLHINNDRCVKILILYIYISFVRKWPPYLEDKLVLSVIT